MPAPIAGATPAEGIRLARVAEPMALRRRHDGWPGTVGTPGALDMATMAMMGMMMHNMQHQGSSQMDQLMMGGTPQKTEAPSALTLKMRASHFRSKTDL